MDIKYNKLLIIQANIILEQAQRLQGKGMRIREGDGNVMYLYYLNEIDELVTQYNLLSPKINKLLKEAKIEDELKEIKKIEGEIERIRDDHVVYNADIKLLQLIFGASNILTFLKEGAILSEENQDRFDSLSQELEDLSKKIGTEIHQNIKRSQDAFVGGHFLGSSLISGRVINSCLGGINGKDINEKIETLKGLDLIRDKDGKDFLLKANHFGRNIVSHDLSIMPTASESISHLGDAVIISKIFSEYKSLTPDLKKEIISKSPESDIENIPKEI